MSKSVESRLTIQAQGLRDECVRLREQLRQAHETLSAALDVIEAHAPESLVRERIEAALEMVGGE